MKFRGLLRLNYLVYFRTNLIMLKIYQRYKGGSLCSIPDYIVVSHSVVSLWLIIELYVVIVHKIEFCTTNIRNKIPPKKGIMPIQIHEDTVATIGEPAVSYDLVKRRCRDLKSGRTFCVNPYVGGAPISVTTDKNFKKQPNIVL